MNLGKNVVRFEAPNRSGSYSLDEVKKSLEMLRPYTRAAKNDTPHWRDQLEDGLNEAARELGDRATRLREYLPEQSAGHRHIDDLLKISFYLEAVAPISR